MEKSSSSQFVFTMNLQVPDISPGMDEPKGRGGHEASDGRQAHRRSIHRGRSVLVGREFRGSNILRKVNKDSRAVKI